MTDDDLYWADNELAEQRTDIVERLRKTLSMGLPDRHILEEAADEIERLRADNAEAHRKLEVIAKHPDVPLLIKQYASGALDGRALEPKP